MPRAAVLFAFVLAFVLGCGSPGGSATHSTPHGDPAVTATGDIADPCWPVAPMRLVVQHAGEWKPVAEMQGDGSMYSLEHGERHFVGRVSNDAVLDAHDTPSMTCIHRQVDVVAGGFKGRYDEQDAFVDTRTRIAVGDDGSVTLTLGGQAPQTGGRVEGVTARTRRTAALFVLSALVAPDPR